MAKLKLKKQPIAIAVISVIGVAVVALLILAGYTLKYKDKVYAHTFIGGTDFGGLTQAQAEGMVMQMAQKLPPTLTVIVDGQKKADIKTADLGVQFNAPVTALNLYAIGRTGSLEHSVGEIVHTMVSPTHKTATVTLDPVKAHVALAKVASQVGVKVKDAHLILNSDGTLTIAPGQSGTGVTENDLTTTIQSQLATFQSQVSVTSHPIEPSITDAEVQAMVEPVKALLDKAPLTLSADTKTASVDRSRLFSWITFSKTATGLAITYNDALMKAYVQDLAKTVNQTAQNAKLGVDNGNVKIVTGQITGKNLDPDKAVAAITSALNDTTLQPKAAITLAVDTVEPKVTDTTLASLGLKEVIGHGETNFVGSPSNRIHNITVGANFLNGALIAPGQEFSTIKTLGAIDGSTGYLPELVIKDNKTVPDFGGGLCQVSTTLFRSVLNAGLKVTKRTNHAYRVSYYEPPVGLDATIFEDPDVDFAFVNDTSNYILVQSKIDGNKISFDLYGTKDGRSSSLTDPVVTDITKPPDPQYVNTDTLPKGTTKQTEHAHDGANTTVTYTVKYADGHQVAQTFHSHYKAWQAVYLVGTKE